MFYFVFVPHDLLLEEGAGAHVVRAASGLLDLCSTPGCSPAVLRYIQKYHEMGCARVPVFQNPVFFLSFLYFTHSSETKE